VEVYRHAFVNLPLEGCNCSDSRLGHFTPEKRTLMPHDRVLKLWRKQKSRFSRKSNHSSSVTKPVIIRHQISEFAANNMMEDAVSI